MAIILQLLEKGTDFQRPHTKFAIKMYFDGVKKSKVLQEFLHSSAVYSMMNELALMND